MEKSETQTVTISCFKRYTNHYTQPKPHRVWWRRMLGQTESKPVDWLRESVTLDVPKYLFENPIVIELLAKAQGHYGFSNQIEYHSSPTPYIPTEDKQENQ